MSGLNKAIRQRNVKMQAERWSTHDGHRQARISPTATDVLVLYGCRVTSNPYATEPNVASQWGHMNVTNHRRWIPTQRTSNAESVTLSWYHHDDVIKWKYFPRYWPFVWGIHR